MFEVSCDYHGARQMLTNKTVDNSDGISIIDVTDPVLPRYCMVSALEAAQRDPKGRYPPLSAKEYVECYYPFINPETKAEVDPRDSNEKEAAMIRTAYEGLLSTSLIDMATLAETWPREYGDSRRQTRWGSGGYDDETINVVNGAKTIDGGARDQEKISSLATMALLKAVQAILQDEENADQIDFLLRVPMGQT
jgi:hypothetical protein